jgi:hypothetical protein
VTRTAKQPEDQSAEKTRIQASLGRQIGQGGIAEARRQQIRGERDTRDQVTSEPASVVRAKPAQGREPTRDADSWKGG